MAHDQHPRPAPLPRQVSVLTWGWPAAGGLLSGAVGLVCVLAPAATLPLLSFAFSLFLILTGSLRVLLGLGFRRWTGWRGGLQVVLGVLLVAAGIVGLVDVVTSLRLFTVLVGVSFLLAAAGDLSLLAASRSATAGSVAAAGGARTRQFLLGSAVVHVVLGAVFLVVPELGLVALAVAVGVVLLALGAAQLAMAFALRRFLHRALAAANGMAPVVRRRPGDDGRTIEGEVL